jgi:hypothetical protein
VGVGGAPEPQLSIDCIKTHHINPHNVRPYPYNRYITPKERKQMPNYNVKVVVEYEYEVEADNEEEAEKKGWEYEDYANWASVYSIDTEELEEEEED